MANNTQNRVARSAGSETELKDKMVALNRVAKVTKGGRTFSFAAIVVVGNEKGVVGFGLGKANEVLDGYVVRQPKAYPVYDHNYKNNVEIIRKELSNYPGLYLVGRNGMHKYNNSDHSMLTAMTAVDNIIAGITNKENIWNINTEQDYHEEK